MKDINILHNVEGIGKSSFGLGQVVKNLAKAQLRLCSNVDIWCLDNKAEINWAAETSGFPLSNIRGFSLTGPRVFLYSPQMVSAACGPEGQKFNIVHQHGIWTGASRATSKLRKCHGVSTVIAPHGSLSRWALNLSPWKKKIALLAYEHNNLTNAACLHATSENEIADFREFGLTNPIAYIENGVQVESLTVRGNAERFREQYTISPEKRILFFLSRISPKKGLRMLIEAINTIRDDFADWQLIIAGIDEFNHKKDIESLINLLNLGNIVKIIDPLFDQNKNDAFAAAELFILPSYSEGFPMVVLDSLAAGVPVITTKASSWSDLTEHNCGWWTDINTPAIATALKDSVTMSAEELRQMGQQGKSLIALKYTWPQLAQKTVLLYDWLLRRDDKPDFVLLD